MRHVEARLVDDLFPVHEQVEVDVRGPHRSSADSPERALDLQQQLENRARLRIVSIATAPFRNGGWSTTPTGPSRGARDADHLDAVGVREELDRPAQRLLRGPRFAPIPTYARHSRERSTTTAA